MIFFCNEAIEISFTLIFFNIRFHSGHCIPHFIVTLDIVGGQNIHRLLVLSEGLGFGRMHGFFSLETARTDSGAKSYYRVEKYVLTQQE